MSAAKQLVPPDGGWGWMVVLGSSLIQTLVMPMGHVFGLIFAQRFATMGLSATDVSVLMNANAATGMLLGLLNGPLLKLIGYRALGLLGGFMISGGIMLSAFATSFTQLLLTFGLIMSLGGMVLMTAFSTAVNLYFKEKLNRATSITVTLSALGPIFFPYFITGLMSHYGAFGCILILGAISTHTIMAALLLQPVEWHMKKIPTTNVANKIDNNGSEQRTETSTGKPAQNRSNTQSTCRIRRAAAAVVKFLDLDILTDSVGLNVLLGMVLIIFVDINFAQITPFVMQDLSFSSNDIAFFMTVISTVDIFGRFISPFIDEYLKFGAKKMMMITLGLMIPIRMGLLFSESYYQVLAVCAILGLVKGASTVYMFLILPSCLPVEKLAAAGGVMMLGCGVFLMTFGPVMGYLRDSTGSYTQCIMVLNALSIIVITFWTLKNPDNKKTQSKPKKQ
ncbi:monocarboxylate transporter 13-like isoform X1 [Ctenocephalides felis]|uniref:monocarboxylate transporter 13-like isoform X1 n=1 Tax=Ctenocephalides felis TaxID=7515 RepID=UPI000E6E12F7|nr:monocarboxylate transporter 13-like isoform X1 [Ctenocephalides felis]